MAEPVSIVLVGIGGMGSVYVRALLEKRDGGLFRIAGAVEPFPERCSTLQELRDMGVPVFLRLEDYYRGEQAELAVISSPIQFHCPQTCLALVSGSHVLCEKPVAGTIQEALRMKEVEEAAKRWVAIGYQWSFSSAVQKLKADIIAGKFGKAKRLKCLYLWPRNEAYYRRSDWAGKRRDAGGAWILDSPANNAMAHDLHNMFYILGRTRGASAGPREVEAELYRAYPIENFDTAAMRCFTEDGVEILFYATHASKKEQGPIFLYEFENGTVTCSSRQSGIAARFSDGAGADYGRPDDEPMNKLWDAIAAVRGTKEIACGLDAASSQTLCINGAQDSMPEAAGFPGRLINHEESGAFRRFWVEGLDEVLESCYEKNALPSELGVDWSRRGEKINLTQYSNFPECESR